MIKKQMMAVRERVTRKAEPVAGPLYFNCHKLVAGIVFHVVDEGIALSFDVGSIERSTERLRRQNLNASISRSQWAEMTHEQRLTWLLVESRTCVVLSGGVASLGPLSTETMIAL